MFGFNQIPLISISVVVTSIVQITYYQGSPMGFAMLASFGVGLLKILVVLAKNGLK